MREGNITPKTIILFILLLLLTSVVIINPVYKADTDDISNPYGENKWKEDGHLKTVSELNDTKGYQIGIDHQVNFTFMLKEDNLNWAHLTMNIENIRSIDPDAKKINLGYPKIKFKIRKEDNIAIVDMENHPLDGYKIGFFPFFGYCKDNQYEKKIEYMGRKSEDVRYTSNTVTYTKKGPSREDESIGNVIWYSVEEDPIKAKFTKEQNPNTRHFDIFSGRYKVNDGKYFPVSTSCFMRSDLFFAEGNNTCRYLRLSAGIDPIFNNDTNYQYLKEIEMDNLYKNDDSPDSNYREVLIIAVPVSIAAASGYIAYKKRED